MMTFAEILEKLFFLLSGWIFSHSLIQTLSLFCFFSTSKVNLLSAGIFHSEKEANKNRNEVKTIYEDPYHTSKLLPRNKLFFFMCAACDSNHLASIAFYPPCEHGSVKKHFENLILSCLSKQKQSFMHSLSARSSTDDS